MKLQLSKSLLWVLVSIVLTVSSSYGQVKTAKIPTEIQNVRTFAKLYGYVRYFHPSDAARTINWERFAIYGVRQVMDASTRQELRATLQHLFRPIAPTVQIFKTGTGPPTPADVLIPADTTGLKLVAWQHRGVSLGTSASHGVYLSIRLNRNGAEPLFKARPDPGEVVNKQLGRGLSAQIPLALFSRNGHTIRPENAPSPRHLQAQLEDIQLNQLTAADKALRYADVIIAWNVFQHFYPYFDVVKTDWNAVLTRTLRRAAKDETSEEFLKTLRRMVAQLDDGHGYVFHPLWKKKARLPFKVDKVEGEIIITVVADSVAGADTCFQRGDIVVSIDGKTPKKVLRTVKKYISGSPQWKTEQALERFGLGDYGTTARLKLRRNGKTHVCRVVRTFQGWLKPERPASIEKLQEGIYYANLGRVEASALREKIPVLANARGVIFDMRGYPDDNITFILQHLSKDTLHSAFWQIPLFIYPDQQNQVGYVTSRWTLPPKKPYFTGEIVFLTGSGAISYAESIMGIVAYYELGEIVGQPTAGTNGGVNSFTLPGQYRIRFTGMRVIKHDRSQHHLIGIKPTIPVEKTIEGVRAGIDEFLQKAIKVIKDAGH